MKELFSATSAAIEELEDSETKKDDQDTVARLQVRLAEIEETKARAYERYLEDAGDTSTLRKVWERKKEGFDRQRDEIEKQLRALSLVETSKKAIGEGFRKKAAFYTTVLGEDHFFTQAIKAQLGLKNTVKLHFQIAKEDSLRAFLKELGAKVYLTWTKDGRYHKLDISQVGHSKNHGRVFAGYCGGR